MPAAFSFAYSFFKSTTFQGELPPMVGEENKAPGRQPAMSPPIQAHTRTGQGNQLRAGQYPEKNEQERQYFLQPGQVRSMQQTRNAAYLPQTVNTNQIAEGADEHKIYNPMKKALPEQQLGRRDTPVRSFQDQMGTAHPAIQQLMSRLPMDTVAERQFHETPYGSFDFPGRPGYDDEAQLRQARRIPDTSGHHLSDEDKAQIYGTAMDAPDDLGKAMKRAWGILKEKDDNYDAKTECSNCGKPANALSDAGGTAHPDEEVWCESCQGD